MKRLLIPIICIFLCGCSQREIENVATVVGAGIDLEGNKITLTAEVVDTSIAGEATGEIFTVTDTDLERAAGRLIDQTGKDVYWEHLKFFLISEDAKLLTTDVINWITESGKTRIETPIGIVKGKVCEIMEKGENEPFISERIKNIMVRAGCQKQTYIAFNELYESGKTTLPLFSYTDKPEVIGSIEIKGEVR